MSTSIDPKVGIVVRLFGADYFGQMIDGASDYLKDQGIKIIVKSGSGSLDGELGAVKALLAENCCGLIIQSDYLTDDTLDEICRQHPNVVFMNRYLPSQKARCVYTDNYNAAKKAAAHLIKYGHHNIAMVTGPEELADVRERSRGFIDQLDNYGLQLPPKLIVNSDFRTGGGYDAMATLLNAKSDFTAIFCQNDSMAAGAMSYCHSVNIRIPEDISIFGFDDQRIARLVSPALSTIKQPLRDIGKRSGQLVHELITGEKQGFPIEPKLTLIDRESVRIFKKCAKDEKVKLSAREVECVNWTSKGKTSYEIAKIVGISENTVVFHLRKAGKKLNTVNRTHLVAKAILGSHLLNKT